MKAVTLVFFLFLPTAKSRPEIPGADFWSMVMRLVYTLDTPDNLFPSLHCSLSWLCVCGLWAEPKIPKWYRGCSLLFCLLIFLSTLTTKQHILIDVLGGWLLAQVCWELGKNRRLLAVYRKILNTNP